MRDFLGLAASVLALHATGALAQVNTTGNTPAATNGADSGQTRGDAAPDQVAPNATRDIVVTAKRLDDARAAIQPSLGATSYTITNSTIQALPGGDNQQFNQVILQLPGVSQDGFGQFHVRDDHNNLQYRINGVILPEGIAVFGQTLSPRIIERFSLLTGALPAQYGLRSAGIIDITTKSGVFNNGGSASIYGGSFNTVEPSVEYGGHSGNTNFFVTGDYRRNDRGIEGVDSSRTPLHDHSDQYQTFAYLDHIVDENNRVSFVGGYSNQYFQIPNPRGLQPDGTYTVNGNSSFLSDNLNERQLEKTAFGQFAFLHDAGPLTYQASVFARYSSLRYRPDLLGELLFNGQAEQAYKQDFTFGGQIDGAYKLNSANTVRAGVIVTRDRGVSRTNTAVFALDMMGNQSGQPINVPDYGGQTELTESVYLQDEFRILPVLTLNVGGRFDHYSGYRAESGFSPRANLVYQSGGTTVHAGYARYFSPPPFELVATNSINKFNGTSAGATPDPVTGQVINTTPFAERQNYFDVGAQQRSGPLTFGVDGYYRRSRNLIDEGQFGAPIVLTPYNYRKGYIYGIEGNVSYTRNGLLAYANYSYSRARGQQLVSSQYLFSPDDLNYISNHYIYLDHDQRHTASGGFSYSVRNGGLTGLRFGADAIYGSGLRAGLVLADGTNIPNGGKLPAYTQVNVSASYLLAHPGISLRFDIVNVGDHIYEIRSGTGVGVGAPQYGPRRGFFGGITKTF